MDIFSVDCPVCSATTREVSRHMAWHVLEGHDVTPERQEAVTVLGRQTQDVLVKHYAETSAST